MSDIPKDGESLHAAARPAQLSQGDDHGTVFADALTDLLKSVLDNPTIGGVVALVTVGLVVSWALNAGKTPTSKPLPKTEDQKEKEAVEAALKAYKIVTTDDTDRHTPSLTGYTTGGTVDGVPPAG